MSLEDLGENITFIAWRTEATEDNLLCGANRLYLTLSPRPRKQSDYEWLLLPCQVNFLVIAVRLCIFAKRNSESKDHSSQSHSGLHMTETMS